jgi:pyruvate dehydrogenase E1 component alpha subunit
MIIEKFDPLGGEIVRVLDEAGRPRADLEPRLTEAQLRRVYEGMVLTRTADQKALKLQRQGRMGTYAPSLGHEACQVGAAFAVQKEDWVFPYFRDMGLYLTLGYPLADYYLYWMGNEAGLKTPEGLNLFPLAIPVASQIPHSVGAGLGARLQKKPIAVLCTFGDGATSEGDFHEALNFAGVYWTPNVFVCYNNQWAISTPRSRQTASATIAQKALSYGFPGVAVDGNDVLAVAAVVGEALDRARRGQGPTLIEAVTYRMGHHTTSDDAGKYRPESEVREWEKKDPLLRFQAYLKNKSLWDKAYEEALLQRLAAEVEEAVAKAESVPPPAVEEIFAHTFKVMPPRLEMQLAETKPTAKEVPS